MPIEKANPLEALDEDDFFQEEGEGTIYNMRELMDQVYSTGDIIFTVPADQVELLKKGLITRKGKDNVKMARAGVKTDGKVLSFMVYQSKTKDGELREGLMDVRVKLGDKKSVNILEIKVPSDEF